MRPWTANRLTRCGSSSADCHIAETSPAFPGREPAWRSRSQLATPHCRTNRPFRHLPRHPGLARQARRWSSASGQRAGRQAAARGSAMLGPRQLRSATKRLDPRGSFRFHGGAGGLLLGILADRRRKPLRCAGTTPLRSQRHRPRVPANGVGGSGTPSTTVWIKRKPSGSHKRHSWALPGSRSKVAVPRKPPSLCHAMRISAERTCAALARCFRAYTTPRGGLAASTSGRRGLLGRTRTASAIPAASPAAARCRRRESWPTSGQTPATRNRRLDPSPRPTAGRQHREPERPAGENCTAADRTRPPIISIHGSDTACSGEAGISPRNNN